MIRGYKFLQESSIEDLQYEVEELLERRWILLGGGSVVCIQGKTWYTQTMISEESLEW